MKPTIKQETARAEQLALNCRWLIDKMDRIHTALCPEKCGSWVKRAEQAVAAAEAIAKNKTAPMQTTLVRDGRTLRALARAGIIEEPCESLRPKGKRWGRGYCYVEAYPRACVHHNGRRFSIAYRDGCLLPFVYEQHGGQQA